MGLITATRSMRCVIVWQNPLRNYQQRRSFGHHLLSNLPQTTAETLNHRAAMLTANNHALRFFGVKKGKEKEKTIIPVPPSIEEDLAVIERRFNVIEREKLGKNRGRQSVKEILKAEKIHKTVTTKMAKTTLNEWLYSRHALRHGFRHILNMKKRDLAQTLIREGTTLKLEMNEAKFILKETFRYGRSGVLEKFQTLDAENEEARKKIEINRQAKVARRREMGEAGYTQEQIQREEENYKKRLRHRMQVPEPQSGLESLTALSVPSLSHDESTATH
jgi:hypothetical protein